MHLTQNLVTETFIEGVLYDWHDSKCPFFSSHKFIYFSQQLRAAWLCHPHITDEEIETHGHLPSKEHSQKTVPDILIPAHKQVRA